MQTRVPTLDTVISDPSRRTTFSIPVPLDPVPIPTYYSSPITVARWNDAPGFNQEFGLHNPEWKILQAIPTATLLEGAIKCTFNVSFLLLRCLLFLFFFFACMYILFDPSFFCSPCL